MIDTDHNNYLSIDHPVQEVMLQAVSEMRSVAIDNI
jgi:hypothetical protein